MKIQANLSFKKVKSRPNNIDFDKINEVRTLFSIKFAKLVTKETLLINIDESSINRSIKQQYSWVFKWTHVEIAYSIFAGSVSMIMVIRSNGSLINFDLNETIGSSNFIWFLKILHTWLLSHKFFEYSQVMIMLDNCAMHKSKTTKSVFQKMPYSIKYLPAYSPDFAPVELLI